MPTASDNKDAEDKEPIGKKLKTLKEASAAGMQTKPSQHSKRPRAPSKRQRLFRPSLRQTMLG